MGKDNSIVAIARQARGHASATRRESPVYPGFDARPRSPIVTSKYFGAGEVLATD